MAKASLTNIVITRRIKPAVPDAMVVRTDTVTTNLAMMLTFDQRTKLVLDLAAYLRDTHPRFLSNGLAIRAEHTVDDVQYNKTAGVIMRWLEEWQIKN